MRAIDILIDFKNRIISLASQQRLLTVLAAGGVVLLGSTALVMIKNLRQTHSQKNIVTSIVKRISSRSDGSSTTTTSDTENQTSQSPPNPASTPTSIKKTTQNNQTGQSADSSQNNQSSTPTSSSNGNQPTATPSSTTPATSATPTPTLTHQLPSCDSNYTFFDTSPVALSEFDGLVPLGNVNPSGHVFPTDHIYFFFNVNTSHNLYSPGQLTVTKISVSENITQGVFDYSIDLQPCRELTIYFLHVSGLSQKLTAALNVNPSFDWDSTYTTGGNTYRNYGRATSVSVNSSEQLGAVGGNPNQSSFDMGAYDTRVTLNFVNPSARSNSAHTVCPIDYYSASLKTALIGRFGDYDGDPKRTTEPVCGTIDQDVAGTAQGVWLVKGTTKISGEDPHLALIHNNIYPNQAVFSVGTSMGASNLHVGYYIFYPQNSGLINRDFDDVSSDGNIYCYEMDGQGWVEGNITILVQLPTSNSLKIERGAASSCGAGPWSFTGNASEFGR